MGFKGSSPLDLYINPPMIPHIITQNKMINIKIIGVVISDIESNVAKYPSKPIKLMIMMMILYRFV